MRTVLAALLLLAVLPVHAQTSGAAGAASDEIATPDPRFIIGEPAGPARSGSALESETVRVSSLLRCPVCQGLSIADSPAPMAVRMKQQVRDLLAAGYSEEQVIRYFESAYGSFVRLEPPMRGISLLVWLLPAVFIVVGAVIVYRIVSNPQRQETARASAAPADGETADEPADPYLERVRRMAYGDDREADRS